MLIANDVPRLSKQIAPFVNTATSVDAVFAHGGITASGGHPIRLYNTLAQRGLLDGMSAADLINEAYFVVDTLDDLDCQWPRIMATRPDLIKTYLLYTDDLDRLPARRDVYGLHPSLLPHIVERAHANGLRVAAHVETSLDFRYAVNGGVDIVAHLPGHLCRADRELSAYDVAPADADLAAERGVIVVTTAGLVGRITDRDRRLRTCDVQRRNLRTLMASGVTLAIGSDNFADTSEAEVAHVRELGVCDDRTLLNIWTSSTPQAIFPRRKVGRLAPGWEATFLSLCGNPLEDWSHLGRIRLRVKRGHMLAVPPSSSETTSENRSADAVVETRS